MKSKNYDKISKECGFHHKNENIQAMIDTTDHLVLICNKCIEPMEIIEVQTAKDYVTWITAFCRKCNSIGTRKIYWKNDSIVPIHCTQKTFKEPKDWEEKINKWIKSSMH